MQKNDGGKRELYGNGFWSASMNRSKELISFVKNLTSLLSCNDDSRRTASAMLSQVSLNTLRWLLWPINNKIQYFLGNIADGVNNFV